MKSINLFVALLLLASCSFWNKKKTLDKDVIARVNDDYLYASDLRSVTRGLKGQDSLRALKMYAENWVQKKLLLDKAIENVSVEETDIARKVEDYKESLLLYEYEKAYIRQKLDTAITPAEMEEWYEKLKSNFQLDKDVYRVMFIKLPKGVPDLDKARKWILKPKDEEDLLRLEGYCREFASLYVTDKGVWYDKETLLKNFPLNEPDISVLTSSGSYREYKNPEGHWFVRVVKILKKDEPSPVELVQSSISRVIIEQRRKILIERVYNKIYEDGLKSGNSEIILP